MDQFPFDENLANNKTENELAFTQPIIALMSFYTGRQLPCGNHTCSRDCHKVKNAPNDLDAGSNCRKCESGCLRPRPEGCVHECKKPCHSDDCEPCGQESIFRSFRDFDQGQ